MDSMKKYTILPVLLALALVISPAVLAYHSWGEYHWARTSNPFTLKLGDNVSSQWDSVLATASSDWSVSSVLDTTVVAGTAYRHRSSNLDCGPVSGTIQVCNKTYGNNGWLGLARIWITDGTHITQGVAKMNDTYFNKSQYSNTNERRHVMCQEVGHIFGLDHQSEDGSTQNTCMDYFSNTGANAGSTLSTHPNAHDYEELAAIYSHLDGSTTIDALALSKKGNNGNGIGVNVDDPSEWGKALGKDNTGRDNIFEFDLGNGQKVVTFIVWTE